MEVDFRAVRALEHLEDVSHLSIPCPSPYVCKLRFCRWTYRNPEVVLI